MQGLHLTADLHHCGCDASWLLDADKGLAECLRAVRAAGLQAVAQLSHAFASPGSPPAGYTATVLLAESHVCLHTWPEHAAATLDVYVCNFGADHSAKAEALMNHLLAIFDAALVEQHALQRGRAPAPRLAAA
jgi:S-adenosylmethionine decarboxylase